MTCRRRNSDLSLDFSNSNSKGMSKSKRNRWHQCFFKKTVEERERERGYRNVGWLHFCRKISLSYVSQPHFLRVIHGWDGDFALADEVVVVDVVGQPTILYMGLKITF